MTVNDLSDYEHRKWLSQTFLGLDEPPKLDSDAIDRMNGMFSELIAESVDSVELIKQSRGNESDMD